MTVSTTSDLDDLPRSRSTASHRLVRGAGIGLLTILFGVVLLAARLGYREYRSLGASPGALAPLVSEEGQTATRVEWPSPSGLVRAWFSKGKSRAAVILVHGSSGHRSQLAFEFFSLQRAGFTVLSLDLPGHGESEGRVDYSGQNLTAIREAAAFLLAQGEQKIGLFGFSLGGYQAVQVTAEEPRIAALAVAGAPADLEKQACSEYPVPCRVSLAPVLLAMKLRGLRGGDRPALAAIEKLHGRPFLVIEGSADPVVPRTVSEPLFARAGSPKQLIVIDGAGHGDYGSHAPETYRKALVDFFERALTDSSPAISG